ncbi:MAG: cobalamin biosynthesis protein [Lachnospiraceae bacterium]|nr:cobalamin biosynthesis protein [Lachnospiraceae bacterium]
MIIGICAFTPGGRKLADQIIAAFPEHIFQKRGEETSLGEWAEKCFTLHAPMLFVGACGIALRSIAPLVADKLEDPPVLVMDEGGEHIIPILSGHMGGANELACCISDRMKQVTKEYKMEPVITTATDVQGLFSVDVFARKNGLTIINRSGIQQVSAKLLAGEVIRASLSKDISYDREALPGEVEIADPASREMDLLITGEKEPEPKATLILRPRELVLGIGCKKGTSCSAIEEMVERQGIDLSEVSSVASIDLKAREYGLLAFCQKYHLPFHTYSSRELLEVDGDFCQSEFVARVTGVGNICERAAAREAGDGYEIVRPKIAKKGITLALAKRKVAIITWETSSIS